MSRKYAAAGIIAAFLLFSSAPAMAQTQGSLAVKDSNGASQGLCNVTSATGSVLVQCANLYVQGAQVSAGNPVPVTVLTMPLATGAATASGVAAIGAALGSPFQAGGTIGNTAFGILGQLPAFATPPTVNLGTVPSLTVGTSALPTGAATSAKQDTTNNALTALTSALGTPLQAGGNIAVTALPALPTGSNTIGTVLAPLAAAPITGQQTVSTTAAKPSGVSCAGLNVTKRQISVRATNSRPASLISTAPASTMRHSSAVKPAAMASALDSWTIMRLQPGDDILRIPRPWSGGDRLAPDHRRG